MAMAGIRLCGAVCMLSSMAAQWRQRIGSTVWRQACGWRNGGVISVAGGAAGGKRVYRRGGISVWRRAWRRENDGGYGVCVNAISA